MIAHDRKAEARIALAHRPRETIGSARRSRIDRAGRASSAMTRKHAPLRARAQCLNAAFTIRGRASPFNSETPMFFFGPHSWRGESGRRYRFKCVLTKKGLPPEGVGGIYVFRPPPLGLPDGAALCRQGRRSPLAPAGPRKVGPRPIGITAPPSATCLGPIRDEVDRRRIEEDLIRGLKPRMNDMEIPQA